MIKEIKKNVTFSLEIELMEKIRLIAIKEEIPITAVITSIILYYLERGYLEK